MKVKVEKKIIDNKFKVVLITYGWPNSDLELIGKYYDPEIDLGGTITVGEDTVSYPHKYRKIYAESPFEFIIDNGADAEVTANAWTNTLLLRMQTAISALRDLGDSFTDEAIVEL